MDHHFFIEVLIQALHARVKSFFYEGTSGDPVETKITSRLPYVKHSSLHTLFKFIFNELYYVEYFSNTKCKEIKSTLHSKTKLNILWMLESSANIYMFWVRLYKTDMQKKKNIFWGLYNFEGKQEKLFVGKEDLGNKSLSEL